MKSNSRGDEAATGMEAPSTQRGVPTLGREAPKAGKEHPAAGSVPPSYGSKGSGGESAQPGAQPDASADRQGKKSAEDEQIESVVRDAEKYVTD